MKLKITSDGTLNGTKLTDEAGNLIQNIQAMDIRWRLDAREGLSARATIEAVFIPYELELEGDYNLKPRWIPVGDRLPEHSPDKTHLVLVWVVSGDSMLGHAETSMLYPNGRWSHLRSEDVVTHWMPLPDAPS